MQKDRVFKNWTYKYTSDFLHGLMVAGHNLCSLDIFSDQKLEKLIELHPDSLSMVYAMPDKVST